MSEAKFTKGPWVAVYRGDNGGGEEGDVHQKAKWDADPFDSGFMRGEFTWPDACLIAAAPELYDALVSLIDSAEYLLNFAKEQCEFMGDVDEEQGFIEKARAALAKARGETA